MQLNRKPKKLSLNKQTVYNMARKKKVPMGATAVTCTEVPPHYASNGCFSVDKNLTSFKC